MEIKVVDIQELEDGGAIYTFDVPEDVFEKLSEKTLLEAIERYLDVNS